MGKVGTEATLLNILGVTSAIARKTVLTSMMSFQGALNDGVAPILAPVGTQFGLKFKRTAESSDLDMPMDVVHYDNDGVFLKSHYAGPEAVAFDAPEAIYYAGDSGLPAGTYHIEIGTAYGDGWTTNKVIQFTLKNALEAGDQIFINFGTDNKIDPTAGRRVDVFAKGSTTSKENTTTSNGSAGTSLGKIGATNAHKPEGQLNGISRVVYGYGRWSQSALRQYMNSDAAINAWWTPQNPWDRPPAQLSTVRGMIAGMDAELLEVVDEIDVVTALNTVEGHTEASEVTKDRFFPPALEQMYINPQLVGEGESWDYYKKLAQEAGLNNKFAQYGTYPILIGYDMANPASPVGVRLRSATRGNATNTWAVSSSGYVYTSYATSAHRACAACKIKKKS